MINESTLISAMLPIIFNSIRRTQEVEDRGTGSFMNQENPLDKYDAIINTKAMCEVVDSSYEADLRNVYRIASYFGITKAFAFRARQLANVTTDGYVTLQKLITLHAKRFTSLGSTVVFSFNFNNKPIISPIELHDSLEFRAIMAMQAKSAEFTSWVGLHNYSSIFGPRVYRFLMQWVSGAGLDWFECWVYYDIPYCPSLIGYIAIIPARRYVSADRPRVFGLLRNINAPWNYDGRHQWRVSYRHVGKRSDKNHFSGFRKRSGGSLFHRKLMKRPTAEDGEQELRQPHKSEGDRNSRNFKHFGDVAKRRLMKRTHRFKFKTKKWTWRYDQRMALKFPQAQGSIKARKRHGHFHSAEKLFKETEAKYYKKQFEKTERPSKT